MKISQAIDLYVQCKQDAGMRFDSSRTNCARFFALWRYRASSHHRPANHRIPRGLRRDAQHLEQQTWHAASLFRILDCTRPHEILSAAALSPKTRRASFRISTRDPNCARFWKRFREARNIGLHYVGGHTSARYSCFCMELACGLARHFASGSWTWISHLLWLRYAIQSFISRASCRSDRKSRTNPAMHPTSRATKPTLISHFFRRRTASFSGPGHGQLRSLARDRRRRTS